MARTRTTKAKRQDAVRTTFAELNAALLATEDVATLERWLADAVAAGVMYRALRVHGRLNGVRRREEIARIKIQCDAARRGRAT